jgi:hypothetical protein
MKTTLNIRDSLLISAKRQALEQGTTLTKVIEDALETALTNPLLAEKQFEFNIPIRQGARPPDVDISNRNDLYDLMEIGD